MRPRGPGNEDGYDVKCTTTEERNTVYSNSIGAVFCLKSSLYSRNQIGLRHYGLLPK